MSKDVYSLLLLASNNNDKHHIEHYINEGADPYSIFGEYLENSPSPFREWFNEYLHQWKTNQSSKSSTKQLHFLGKLLKINDHGQLSKLELLKKINNNLDQHIKFPIWFQHINAKKNNIDDQTPNIINAHYPKGQNPHTLCFENTILDPKEQAFDTHGIATPELTGKPTPFRPNPQKNWRDFSIYEIALAFRNHGFPMEALSYPITPLGLHYTLIHFDIPTHLKAQNYTISIGGQVNHPFTISLDELMQGPIVEQVVTMQCAGVGRGLVNPRPVYVPWSKECVGTYKWTGTPLKYVLERAGLLNTAVEVVFTGNDTGVDLGVEHSYEKAIPLDEAINGDVMLCWANNDVPLLPQHGFPLRVIVPNYYGSYSVKWLRAITVVDKKFDGVQQNVYSQRRTFDGNDKGVHFTKKQVDSLILPPGISDLLTRHRFLAPGTTTLKGTAWSGVDVIDRVEISVDNLKTWTDAKIVHRFKNKYGWVQWEYEWNPIKEGDYVIASRAYDKAGNSQLLNPECDWNRTGMGITSVERLVITVKKDIGCSKYYIPSNPQLIVKGAIVPKPPSEIVLAKFREIITKYSKLKKSKSKTMKHNK